MAVYHFKETKVFQKAFALAIELFEISKTFPKEETYSLTNQMRRSSRSVCTNIEEAYRKKQYPPTLLQRFLMPIWKIQRHWCGWILL